MSSRASKVLLVLFVLLFLKNQSVLGMPRPDVAASAAVLMDFETGKVIYSKNSYERRAPASTTKILTALVALERGEMNQIVTASNNASKTDGSSIWLSSGEEHTLEELLYGVLLSSGNDASVAIAEGLAGSEAKFVSWMNEKAQVIGAKDSCFKNSNGLPEPGHYSTAYDLALITRYALHNSIFAEMVKTKKKTINWPGRDYNRLMVNHNKLLWRYQFADGVKTGYTRQAGKCLVASATKNGQRLIVVVLNSKQIYEDSKRLLEYGFDNYQLVRVIGSEQKLGTIAVVEGIDSQVTVFPNRPVTILVPKGRENEVEIKIDIPRAIPAPVERLQQVGELEVKIGGRLLEKVPVITAANVPKENLWRRFWNWLKSVIV